MISSSPKNAPLLLGATTGIPLGVAATVCLIAAGSLLNAGLNALILTMAGTILAVWRKVGGLADGVVWLEIVGIAVLELAICIWCVMMGA
jgi:hypothetical protein